MKFSYNWIREFVPGLDVDPQSLERLITMKTAECDGIEVAGELLNGAVLANVLEVEKIEGQKNVVAKVDAGPYGMKTVVCGASNCRAGIITAYVPLGKKVVSGIESDGMLAAADELGINNDHGGILELTADTVLPPVDHAIEIDNKSITHRPDLWGHHGMAREVAAITGHPLRDPADLSLLPPAGAPVQIEIEDLHLCPRYSALVFDNVTVQPSPLWLQARLTAAGLNTKNNIVDLSNYLMAELAQPTHAFDRAKLAGDTIWARPAREGESIVALNDETYSLSPANLVIADASGPIAIAGVIGGKDSAISAGTTSIVFESANFNAGSVRRTSSSLKLRTDASMRFEKAQDPVNTLRALARALELLPILSPGIRLVGGLADNCAELKTPPTISLDLDWLARKLGRVLDPAEVRRILEALQFKVSDNFEVSVPTWRATKDIAMAEDLVEEVGRMIGYSSIEPQPPMVPCAPSFDPPEREFLRGIRRHYAAQGFTEVSNYSFISEEEAKRFGFAPEDHVRVLNPIAEGQELMRTSLLPGIHRNLVENAKHFEDFRLFEVGREIHLNNGEKPIERPHVVAAIYSRHDDGRAALMELKRVSALHSGDAEIRPATAMPWEHPSRAAEVILQGQVAGRLFELHPNLIDTGRAALLYLDLAKIPTQLAVKYQPVRRFPTSSFDLSVICPAREYAATVDAAIRNFAGELAEAIEFVTDYQMPDSRKSLSFRIVLGAADRTLAGPEVTAVRERIIEGLRGLHYELTV
ncbi:MAG: phenylalanine--tRNA ligase subunit beta [Acidobacteriia bacterium]|nr:phenylalanine--tRNA ligase subunit beta [Terriglobia bacterium]